MFYDTFTRTWHPGTAHELHGRSWVDLMIKARTAQRLIDNSPSLILTLCERNPPMPHEQSSFTPPDRPGVTFTRGERVRYMADVVTIHAIYDRAVELWYPEADAHVSVPRTGPDSWKIGQIQKFNPCAGKLTPPVVGPELASSPRPLLVFKDQDGIEIQVGDRVYGAAYPNMAYTVKELLPNGLRCGGVMFPGSDFTFHPDPDTRVEDLTYATPSGDVLKVGDRVTLLGSSPCVITRIRSNGRVWLRYEDSGMDFPGTKTQGAINYADKLQRVPQTVTITRTVTYTGTPEQVERMKRDWEHGAEKDNRMWQSYSSPRRQQGFALGTKGVSKQGVTSEVTAYTEETK